MEQTFAVSSVYFVYSEYDELGEMNNYNVDSRVKDHIIFSKTLTA